MEATEKEKKLINQVLQLKLSLIVILGIVVCFIFAKVTSPEYRPIVVNTRSIATGTAYQPSTSRYTMVSVSVQVACALSLTGGAAGNVSLQTSPDNITYTTVQQLTNANSGSLTIGLNITNTNGAVLSAVLPPNYYYKLVSAATTGSPTFSVLTSSQEVQL